MTQTFEKGQIGGDLPQAGCARRRDQRRRRCCANSVSPRSNKEARRKLDEGAVKVDGAVVRDLQHRILPGADPGSAEPRIKNMAL